MPINSIMISPLKLDLSLAHLRQCKESAIKNMVFSFEKLGQLNPIVVAGDTKHMVLVDGFKRHRAAGLIGMNELQALVLPLQGAQMKAHTYILNRNNGFSFVEECLLIHELIEQDGLLQTEIAVMLERHKSWVSRRLDLYRSLSPQIIEDIRVGMLQEGSGRSLARLPQGNQVDMSAVILRDGLKTNEVKRLVDLWCKADTPEGKSFVIEHSRKALELSCPDFTRKIDPTIPAAARDFLKAVQNLKQSAIILKQKSIKGFYANPHIETILNQAFKDAEKECQEALSCVSAILTKEKSGAT